MGWLIDCKRSRSFLQSKTAAAAPRSRVAAGTGQGFCAISDRGGLGGSWRGGCFPPPLHLSDFSAFGLKLLLGSLSQTGCVRPGGMCPCPRTAQPRPGGQGSPLSTFTGWAGVPPCPVRVCTWGLQRATMHVKPLARHTSGGVWVVPWKMGDLGVGMVPSFRVGFLGPACPTASPWLSGPCPAGRAPRNQQSVVAALLGSRSARGALGSGGKTSCTDQ